MTALTDYMRRRPITFISTPEAANPSFCSICSYSLLLATLYLTWLIDFLSSSNDRCLVFHVFVGRPSNWLIDWIPWKESKEGHSRGTMMRKDDISNLSFSYCSLPYFSFPSFPSRNPSASPLLYQLLLVIPAQVTLHYKNSTKCPKKPQLGGENFHFSIYRRPCHMLFGFVCGHGNVNKLLTPLKFATTCHKIRVTCTW